MTMLKTPVHPGEILKHEFLEEMDISAGKLAKHMSGNGRFRRRQTFIWSGR